mgnify:FL=1
MSGSIQDESPRKWAGIRYLAVFLIWGFFLGSTYHVLSRASWSLANTTWTPTIDSIVIYAMVICLAVIVTVAILDLERIYTMFDWIEEHW